MTDEKFQSFSNDIKKRREEKELKQYECARHCGVSVNSYRSWEIGITKPKEKNVRNICTFLGLNVGDYE